MDTSTETYNLGNHRAAIFFFNHVIWGSEKTSLFKENGKDKQREAVMRNKNFLKVFQSPVAVSLNFFLSLKLFES